MYKLLIVDDEPLVQVGIKSMLPWQDMNITISGIASNGQFAFEMIEKEKPDIVITDIKMPIMSGLELAKKCLENYEDASPAFIILTSYEDFSLAREALTYHVSDYLVKLDLSPEILRESIEKILKELDKKKSLENASNTTAPDIASYHDKFFIRLMCNLFESHEQFEFQKQELHLSFDYAAYVCCYCELVNTLSDDTYLESQMNLFHTAYQMSLGLFGKYQKCHVITLDLRHFAVIFCYEEEGVKLPQKSADIIRQVSTTLTNYYNVYLRAGVGVLSTSVSGISESYQCAKNAFIPALENNCIAVFDEITVNAKDSFNFAIIKDNLTKSFEEYDAEALDTTLSEFIALFRDNPSHFLQAMDFISSILFLAISTLPNGDATVNDMFSNSAEGYRTLYKINNMEGALDYLTRLKDSLCQYFTERKKEIRKPIVTQVKRYIKEHVSEKLTLNEVAATFGISPNYLSQLFKKYNDMGFNDYVNQCKINEAKHLLSCNDYKVYEVAEILGFESAFYFSKVFKKIAGIPPTEYISK